MSLLSLLSFLLHRSILLLLPPNHLHCHNLETIHLENSWSKKKGNLSEYKRNGHLKKNIFTQNRPFWWWKTNSSELSFPAIEWVSSSPNGPTIPTIIENGPTNLPIQRLSDYPNGIQIIVLLHDKQITLQAKRSHIPDFGKGTSSTQKCWFVGDMLVFKEDTKKKSQKRLASCSLFGRLHSHTSPSLSRSCPPPLRYSCKQRWVL